jgi:hypothetical protein
MKSVDHFQRLIKKIDRTISGPVVEFSEQFLYGNREVLCAYSGLDHRFMIHGSLEHGWTSYPPGKGIPKIYGGKYTHLVWSSYRLQQSSESYSSNVIAIGSPFLYAHNLVINQLEESADVNSSFAGGTIFFPGHGTEVTTPNMIQQIEAVKRYENPKNVTVCLYWTEFLNPEIRAVFKQAGFKLTNLGYSGLSEHTGLGMSSRKNVAGTLGGRHTYLLNLLLLLNSHQKVIVGDVGTAALYSAFMKKDLLMLPEWLENLVEPTHQDVKSRVSDDYRENHHIKYIENHMDMEYAKIDFSSQKFRDYALLELGVADQKKASELKELLASRGSNQVSTIPVDAVKQYIKDFKKHKIQIL